MKFKKTMAHLTAGQLIWTLWALCIFLIIQLGQIILALFFGGNDVDFFYNASYVAGNIYMFVIGIMAIHFLPYVVGNGITRKDYFKGNLVAGVIVSILIPIAAYILSVIIRGILTSLTSFDFRQPDFDTIPETDSNIIGDILQSFLLAPFIDVESNVLLSLGLFSLNLFVFYLIGWMIGSAFYRLNVVSGIIFIFIGVIMNTVKDSMLRVLLDQPLFINFNIMEGAPSTIAVILIVAVILLTILFVRLLTKRTAIKL